MRPGPTARTVPSCGFSLAVSGITMPDAVVVSASFAWTTMRSSSGLIATLVAVVTGIPSWGTGSLRTSISTLAAPSSRVPAPPGWHSHGEGANRTLCRGLALRQGECQRRGVPPAHKVISQLRLVPATLQNCYWQQQTYRLG